MDFYHRETNDSDCGILTSSAALLDIRLVEGLCLFQNQSSSPQSRNFQRIIFWISVIFLVICLHKYREPDVNMSCGSFTINQWTKPDRDTVAEKHVLNQAKGVWMNLFTRGRTCDFFVSKLLFLSSLTLDESLTETQSWHRMLETHSLLYRNVSHVTGLLTPRQDG